jgi:hypothetical protein
MKKIVLLFIFLLSISFVFSQGITKPHAFYGDVYYSDRITLLENGFSVTAKIEGVIVGSSEIMNGKYDLIIEGKKGKTIYFYINEKEVKNYIFEEFGITKLDFFTDIVKPTSPENNDNNEENNNNDGGSLGGGSPSDSSTTQTNENTIKLNIETEDDSKDSISLDKDKTSEKTSLGITGAVIGFVKSGGAIGLIFILLIVGIGVMILKKGAPKNE